MQKNLLEKYKDRVKFSNRLPPVFEQAKALFDVSWDNTTFAYAPCIHDKNPSALTEDVIQHEMVHIKRQNGDPEIWWGKYLTDDKFRLDEEIVAYQRQYRWMKANNKDRNYIDKQLRFWCTNLSGGAYGFLTTYEEARKLITQ